MKKIINHIVKEKFKPLKLGSKFCTVTDQLIKHFKCKMGTDDLYINLYDNRWDEGDKRVYAILYLYEGKNFRGKKILFQFDISIQNKILAYLSYYFIIWFRYRINYC